LDLAALYASSEPVKSSLQPSDNRFSALYNLTSINGDAGAPGKKAADNSSLASLEQSMLADLKI